MNLNASIKSKSNWHLILRRGVGKMAKNYIMTFFGRDHIFGFCVRYRDPTGLHLTLIV